MSEDGSRTTLELFTDASGVEVTYVEDINDGQEFYAKVRDELEAGRDPGREYTLPWQSGFTGLGWNAPLLQERLGVNSLASLEQFFDPSDFTDPQFEQTLAVLQQYVDDGHIRQVTGNDYISGLDSGDLIAVMGWSGDVLALGEDYGFALPESGGLIWADSMIIPSVATHKSNAEKLMDFYYDPEIAAQLVAYIQCVCPVVGAREAMERIAPSMVDDPWVFPPAEVIDSAYVTAALTSARAETLDRAFDSVVSG